MSCWSSCLWSRIAGRHGRSGSTSMRPMTPVHGHQEGRFFHGYYGCYCYLPLYIFCGEHLVCARLRPSDRDASAGSVEELERIVGQLRRHWPNTRIGIRGDSGFCRESILRWCEDNGIDYVLGLARNERLVRAIGAQMRQAQAAHRHTGKAARRYRDFTYRTRKSWTSRSRRVVGKAEYLTKGENPRFERRRHVFTKASYT